MPTKNPRVNVVLERPLYDALGRLARREGSSLSTKARDLLRDALETYEDVALAKLAEARERTLVRSAGLTHDEVWRGGAGRKSGGPDTPRGLPAGGARGPPERALAASRR